MQKTIEELERELADAEAIREERTREESKAHAAAAEARATVYDLKRRLYLTRALEADEPLELSIYRNGYPIDPAFDDVKVSA